MTESLLSPDHAVDAFFRVCNKHGVTPPPEAVARECINSVIAAILTSESAALALDVPALASEIAALQEGTINNSHFASLLPEMLARRLATLDVRTGGRVLTDSDKWALLSNRVDNLEHIRLRDLTERVGVLEQSPGAGEA